MRAEERLAAAAGAAVGLLCFDASKVRQINDNWYIGQVGFCYYYGGVSKLKLYSGKRIGVEKSCSKICSIRLFIH